MASSRLTGLGRGTPIAVARVTDPRFAERHPSATPLHLLLWASVLFNLLLCFVDSHVARLGAGQVILSEVLILAAAVALPFQQPDRSPCRWNFDQAFRSIGSHAFTGVAGQLQILVANNTTYISGDVNGDQIADFTMTLDGSHSVSSLGLIL